MLAENKEKQQYLEKYNSNTDASNGLEQLVNAMGAMSALVPMFDRLAKHAPDEIQSDVMVIRDALRQQQDLVAGSASDPLGGLAGSIMAGMMSVDSWERVSTFVWDNCVSDAEKQEIVAAQQAAVKQAETDQATSNLDYAVSSLQSTLDEEVDLTYQHYFDSIEQSKQYALENLRYYRENGPDSGDFCGAPGALEIDRERAETDLANLKASLVSPDDLQREADGVSEAADALRALDPKAPELGAVDAKLAEAQQRMDSIDAANAEAVAKMEELLEPFAGYVDEANELNVAAC